MRTNSWVLCTLDLLIVILSGSLIGFLVKVTRCNAEPPVPVTKQPMGRVVCKCMSLCTPQPCVPIISGPSVVLSFHGNGSMRAQKGVETIMVAGDAAKGKSWRLAL